MNKLIPIAFSVLLLASCGGAGKDTAAQKSASHGGTNMEQTAHGFSERESAITRIASLAAAGEIERLTAQMENALSAKTLSQNEIGEICLQLYAYAGFPR
ncbi:MAG: hypothetical protein II921_05160, partial [Treponema sp.]|nr:hypothetical protein [Treponema sp.]